jgi:hypothetical protein
VNMSAISTARTDTDLVIGSWEDMVKISLDKL